MPVPNSRRSARSSIADEPPDLDREDHTATRARYRAYLKSDHWRDLQARYRASNRPQTCLVCGETKVDLHHWTYIRFGHERLDDLMPLCREHHWKAHGDMNVQVPHKRAKRRATTKQLAFIVKLGGTSDPAMTMGEATKRCQELQRKQSKRERNARKQARHRSRTGAQTPRKST